MGGIPASQGFRSFFCASVGVPAFGRPLRLLRVLGAGPLPSGVLRALSVGQSLGSVRAAPQKKRDRKVVGIKGVSQVRKRERQELDFVDKFLKTKLSLALGERRCARSPSGHR